MASGGFGGTLVLEWLVTGALALAAAKPAWTALRGLGADVERTRREERAEFAVRTCGRLSAAARNLDDAAAWISEREPRLRLRARRLARATVARLEERYGRQAAERCDGEAFVATVRRESTGHVAGRDEHWPNWVVEFSAPEADE